VKVAGQRFSIVGMGKSGLSAARALIKRGGDCLLSDNRDDEELRKISKEFEGKAKVVLGKEVVRDGDIAVLSPGISPDREIFRVASKVASEVIGEVELFYRLFDGRMVAVTGTDGKSTVTTLIAHILRHAGVPAYAGGNLGNALCSLLDEVSPDSVVVAEVSCFQLLTVRHFRPFVALVTNIAYDHIEYHGSFEAYVRAKARVFMNQAHGDFFVRNRDDLVVSRWLTPSSQFEGNGQKVLEVSQNGPVSDGAWTWGKVLHLAKEGKSAEICRVEEIFGRGRHIVENCLLACAACIPFGIEPQALRKGLLSFKGLRHRIEFVNEVAGVRFYNDSKATNPHAAAAGILSFDEKLVLIAGGHEKGLPLEPLVDAVAQRCVACVLCGENAKRMALELGKVTDVVVVGSLDEAVTSACEIAVSKGVKVVLLSPASSSFDAFRDFEERGERFENAVLKEAERRGQ